jgi:hypothetical protein
MITPRDLPPATALWKARERAISLPSNYTTTRDATPLDQPAAEMLEDER